MLIIEHDWYKETIAKEYPRLNKFIQNFIIYRYDFNVAESLFLSFHSMKRHHAKIIRQMIYELSHDEYGMRVAKENYSNRVNVFEVVEELYRPMPIHDKFSGLECIHGHKLSSGHFLEICFNRASIANMAGKLDLCTATKQDLVRDQRLGKMLRINIMSKKEIIANICVHAEQLLTKPSEKNSGFYILGKDHKYWDENYKAEIFSEIKNHLNEYLKIYDFDIAIP